MTQINKAGARAFQKLVKKPENNFATLRVLNQEFYKINTIKVFFLVEECDILQTVVIAIMPFILEKRCFYPSYILSENTIIVFIFMIFPGSTFFRSGKSHKRQIEASNVKAFARETIKTKSAFSNVSRVQCFLIKKRICLPSFPSNLEH